MLAIYSFEDTVTLFLISCQGRDRMKETVILNPQIWGINFSSPSVFKVFGPRSDWF